MTRKYFTAAVAAAAITLALTGCGADGQNDATPPQTTGSQAVTDVTHMPGEIENYEGAAQDASTTKCEHVGDKWEVAGTVKNSAAEARDYRIFVSLLSPSDTIAVSEVNLTGVEPNATQEWSSSIDVTQEGLECVLRVERFAPGAAVSPEKPAEDAPGEELPAEAPEPSAAQ